MLAGLSSHFWTPDFTPAQAAARFKDYTDDLGGCTVAEIEIAIRDYRLQPKIPGKMKPFPGTDDLLALVRAQRKHRADLAKVKPAKLEYGETRPHMWWTKPPKLWQPHWQESEIPEAHREAFRRRMDAKRAAGEDGWAVADFASLARKQQGEVAP
jgi:hypothetical protein